MMTRGEIDLLKDKQEPACLVLLNFIFNESKIPFNVFFKDDNTVLIIVWLKKRLLRGTSLRASSTLETKAEEDLVKATINLGDADGNRFRDKIDEWEVNNRTKTLPTSTDLDNFPRKKEKGEDEECWEYK